MTLDPIFLNRPLAHRGLHGLTQDCPENSPAAFQQAILGRYGIELDIQLASDGQAMVFHDYVLDRLTCEKGRLGDLDAATLGQIPLKGGTDRIPTLDAVLKLIDGQTPVLIEIKDQDGNLGPNTGALEADCARVLASYSGPVAVMSFNPYAIQAFKKQAPKVSCGLITADFMSQGWDFLPDARRKALSTLEDVARLDAEFVSHDVNDLESKPISALKSAGLPILCWTIRSPAQEAKARAIADNITFEGYRA